MIVPRPRLLCWFAIVVLPFALVAAVEPAAAATAAAAILVFAALAAIDAILARGSIEGLQAELPDVVRLSRERDETIDLRIVNPGETQRRLRVGLPFPHEVAAVEEQTVLLPASVPHSSLPWRCRASRRGRFRLERVCWEGSSPLGFWSARSSTPVQCELRVYPNLLTERKATPALFLHRGAFGMHARRQAGKGREFEKLREYIPGDDYNEIHWKATAKRGRPVTKVFQIEKTQEVYVVIDASRLTARVEAAPIGRGEGTTTLERFVTAALVLALAAERQGDHYGLLTFTDKVETFLRARNGRAHYGACRDALYTLQPRMVSPDFDDAASFIRVRLRKRALIVYLTALDDPVIAEGFVRSMDLLRRQHLILVNMLTPPTVAPLFGGPGVESMDDLYERLGGHVRWHALRELERVLRRSGVRLVLLDSELLSAQLVSEYAGIRQRQLL